MKWCRCGRCKFEEFIDFNLGNKSEICEYLWLLMNKIIKYFSIIIISIFIIFFISINRRIHDFLVINRTNEVITVIEMRVNGNIVSNREVDIDPIAGRSDVFSTFYVRSGFLFHEKLDLTVLTHNGIRQHLICFRKDKNSGRCIFRIGYKGYSGEIGCGCDPLNDFD